jgi:cholesterol transport system auxiliary component
LSIPPRIRWCPVLSISRATIPLRRLGALLLAAGMAAGCSSGPAPTTFDLTAPTVRGRAIARQVLVAEPAAVQILSNQQIVVRDEGGTVSFLGEGQWADNLPRLVQARLIHTFENASNLRGITRPSSGAVADVQLISELRAFQVSTPSNEAVVEISAKIVSDQTGRILSGRIFAARVPVVAVDAANGARALDEALSTVMLDIVRWVSAMQLPSRDEPVREAPAT